MSGRTGELTDSGLVSEKHRSSVGIGIGDARRSGSSSFKESGRWVTGGEEDLRQHHVLLLDFQGRY